MIVGIGTDIIEIERISKAVSSSERFINKVFTIKEQEYLKNKKNRFEIMAGNFAAKEAFAKAIGTGIRRFQLIDIEVLRNDMGKPYIVLYNNALKIVKGMGIENLHISISHCKMYAVATVISEK